MEGQRVDCENQTMDHHKPTRRLTRLQIGEGDGDGNHGGKAGTKIRGNSPGNTIGGIYRCLESLQLLR